MPQNDCSEGHKIECVNTFNMPVISKKGFFENCTLHFQPLAVLLLPYLIIEQCFNYWKPFHTRLLRPVLHAFCPHGLHALCKATDC